MNDFPLDLTLVLAALEQDQNEQAAAATSGRKDPAQANVRTIGSSARSRRLSTMPPPPNRRAA